MGKGRHIRTVPVPDWVKAAVDEWTKAAGIADGRVFRCVSRTASIWGNGINGEGRLAHCKGLREAGGNSTTRTSRLQALVRPSMPRGVTFR
jgi:hypothetical protein